MSTTNDATGSAEEEENVLEVELTAATKVAIYAISKWQEPTEQLTVIRDYLRQAAETDSVGSDPVFAKFLYEELAPGLTKKLARERSVDDVVSILVK